MPDRHDQEKNLQTRLSWVVIAPTQLVATSELPQALRTDALPRYGGCHHLSESRIAGSSPAICVGTAEAKGASVPG
jgi:hypothetical protein